MTNEERMQALRQLAMELLEKYVAERSSQYEYANGEYWPPLLVKEANDYRNRITQLTEE